MNRSDKNLKHIFGLTLGTGIASLVPVIVVPLLTRLYTPEDFGQFEIFSSSLLLLSPLATLRLEYALVLSDDREHTLHIMAAAIINSLIFSFILFLGLVIFFQNHYLLFPFLFFTYCLSEIGKKWLARERSFKKVSAFRFINAIGSNGFKWIFGLMKLEVVGLVLGNALGQLSILLVSKELWRVAPFKLWRSIVKKYKHFALGNAPEAIILGLKDLALPLVLSAYYGEYWLGMYGLTLKILKAPIFTLGAALSDVYFREFAHRRSELEFIKVIVKRYALLMFVPFFVVMWVLPPWMGEIFGAQWVEAGFFVRVLSLIYWISFINLIFMDKLPILYNRQTSSLVLTFVGEVLSIGALLLCIWMKYDVQTSFLIYAVVQGISKIYYSVWCWKLIR